MSPPSEASVHCSGCYTRARPAHEYTAQYFDDALLSHCGHLFGREVLLTRVHHALTLTLEMPCDDQIHTALAYRLSTLCARKQRRSLWKPSVIWDHTMNSHTWSSKNIKSAEPAGPPRHPTDSLSPHRRAQLHQTILSKASPTHSAQQHVVAASAKLFAS